MGERGKLPLSFFSRHVWRGSIKNPYPKTPLPSPRNEGGSGHPREGYGWRDLSFNPSISILLVSRQSSVWHKHRMPLVNSINYSSRCFFKRLKPEEQRSHLPFCNMYCIFGRAAEHFEGESRNSQADLSDLLILFSLIQPQFSHPYSLNCPVARLILETKKNGLAAAGARIFYLSCQASGLCQKLLSSFI